MSPPAIEVSHLTKRFGEVLAVDDVSFQVAQGECVALLGPNGAGKTTTLEILEGLQPATSGAVTILGKRWEAEPDFIRSRIGIQLQETNFRNRLTVREVAHLFRSFYRRGMEVDRALEMVSLQEQSGKLVMNLSGGQKQRLGLAVALLSEPDILFLDEPTTGLDPRSRRDLWALVQGLKKQGRTIVLTTHYMDEAEYLCDRLLIMDRGRIIAEGSPGQLVRSFGGDAVVELSTQPLVPPEVLAAVAGVARVAAHEEALRLSVSQVHSTLPAVLGAIAQQGCTLTHLVTRTPSLDDVFLSITGRRIEAAQEEP